MTDRRPAGMFSKFSDAADDLLLSARHASEDWARRECRSLSAAIASAQKFYLPDGANVLAGKTIDQQMKPLLRLPYDTIAILHDQTTLDERQAQANPTKTQAITVAFTAASDFNVSNRLGDPEVFNKPGFFVTSVVLASPPTVPERMWVPAYMYLFVHLPEDRPGVELLLLQSEVARRLQQSLGYDAPSQELMDDVMASANLCAMLGLANVRTADVTPSNVLNASRAKKGKRPLYSYKVLEVGGERWDSLAVSEGGSDRKLRSHLRRGHIRRLDSDRMVWVSATYVRGKSDGFVHKDYAAVHSPKPLT